VRGCLAQRYQELPIAAGAANRGALVEVLSTGDGETWTIIIFSPDGEAGKVAIGKNWRAPP